MSTTYLETERLILRPFTTADVDNLAGLDGDPEVMRYLNGGEPTPREVIQQKYLPRYLGEYERFEGFGHWAAHVRDTGEFVGWFGLCPEGDGNLIAVELGYRLRPSAWGNGFATEGARGLIRNAFTRLGVERVLAHTYQDNLASIRVMEKAGMSLARRFRPTIGDLVTEDDIYRTVVEVWDGDEVEYCLEKATWVAQEASRPDERVRT
ncbi:MAG: GNAT family N-acetyltransferase [Chloroflexota bacterium]